MALAAYAGTSLIVEMEITEPLRKFVKSTSIKPVRYMFGEGWMCTYCTGMQLLVGMWIINHTIPSQLEDIWWSFIGLGAAAGLLWLSYDLITNTFMRD